MRHFRIIELQYDVYYVLKDCPLTKQNKGATVTKIMEFRRVFVI